VGKGNTKKRKKPWITSKAVAKAFAIGGNSKDAFLDQWTPDTADCLEKLLRKLIGEKSLLKDRKYTRQDLVKTYQKMYMQSTSQLKFIVETTHHTLQL
jgi:hypothetical protein